MVTGLKMCILIGYNTQNIFFHCEQNELSHFSCQSERILDILCVQLLQFYANCFTTLQMFWMCICFIFYPQINDTRFFL